MELLLRFGANVNYYCRVNTTHFPSALQYALKDQVNRCRGRRRLPLLQVCVLQVVLRMLCHYGYDVHRCFDCPYGDSAHVPEGYEGWSDSVIKDTLVRARPASTAPRWGSPTSSPWEPPSWWFWGPFGPPELCWTDVSLHGCSSVR